jgi:hypothetical protein
MVKDFLPCLTIAATTGDPLSIASILLCADNLASVAAPAALPFVRV